MAVNLDQRLAQVTRRLRRIRGSRHLVAPLERRFSAYYNDAGNGWAKIDDFDGNLQMLLDRGSHIGSTIYWYGTYHGPELDYLSRRLTPDMTFVDIGANQGVFTLFAAKRLVAGRVIAFEPQAKNYNVLNTNLDANGLTNVLALKLALGSEKDTVALYSPVRPGGALPNEGMYSLYGETSPGAPLPEIVEVDRLDAVLDEHGIGKVDLVKIDVEGSEFPVLLGASTLLSAWKPCLILEINRSALERAGYGIEDLKDYLGSFGYKFHSFDRKGSIVPIDIAERACRHSSFNVLCS